MNLKNIYNQRYSTWIDNLQFYTCSKPFQKQGRNYNITKFSTEVFSVKSQNLKVNKLYVKLVNKIKSEYLKKKKLLKETSSI